MKKLLITALAAIMTLGVKAEMTEVLIVALKDNTTVEFILNESPKIKFASEELTITSTTLSGQYAYANVRNLHFESKDITAIKSAKVADNTMRIFYNGANEYTIAGLKATDNVQVFNTSGQKLLNKKAQEGTLNISLQEYNTGTYIINIAGKHSFKVIKK